MTKTLKIGGASGYWGDAAIATPQLLASQQLDYLVYDYLAEVTMSIMARARAKDPQRGYAIDFVEHVLADNLAEIKHQGVKVIANAGGVNPKACADAVEQLVKKLNLDLTVAVVHGDDLSDDLSLLKDSQELFSGKPFPDLKAVRSANAYLGAFPIAAALEAGADIVITGRCVDSAVTLGPCIYEFNWQGDELDKLAQGSLAGHLIECGTQVCGGNFTDWHTVVDSLAEAGYPIAEINHEGEVVITKPESTGGLVSRATVAEQLLYEIGDPQCYLLPDVICDFSQVQLEQIGNDRVKAVGCKGVGVPKTYKVSTTYQDGYRGGNVFTVYGREAASKARYFADNGLIRARSALQASGLEDFSEVCVEIIGAESQFGPAARSQGSREVDVKIAASHPQAKGIQVLLKELTGMALSSPPGLCGFAGARPKPSPVVRLFSTSFDKSQLSVQLDIRGQSKPLSLPSFTTELQELCRPELPSGEESNAWINVPLIALAWARSGDKGDKANIGVIARKPEYLPYIAESLSTEKVAQIFAHFIKDGGDNGVRRFYLPGIHGLNFLLNQALGGGGIASLRSDPQGKGFSQILLEQAIAVPAQMAKVHQLEQMPTSHGRRLGDV